VAVPLIYLDEARSFGGAMDQAETRLNIYSRRAGPGDRGGGSTDRGRGGRGGMKRNVLNFAPRGT